MRGNDVYVKIGIFNKLLYDFGKEMSFARRKKVIFTMQKIYDVQVDAVTCACLFNVFNLNTHDEEVKFVFDLVEQLELDTFLITHIAEGCCKLRNTSVSRDRLMKMNAVTRFKNIMSAEVYACFFKIFGKAKDENVVFALWRHFRNSNNALTSNVVTNMLQAAVVVSGPKPAHRLLDGVLKSNARFVTTNAYRVVMAGYAKVKIKTAKNQNKKKRKTKEVV